MADQRRGTFAFRWSFGSAFAAVAWLVVGGGIPGDGFSRPALAQNVLPSADEEEEDNARNVFLPPDRRTLRKLSTAEKLIDEGRYAEAVRFLGEVLQEPEDFFFRPDGSFLIYRSLKSEAERLIGRLPRKGRELYELQYGAQAREMLSEALESGNTSLLAEVSRRFFHTRGGYQATYLLGLHHFDHGRPLAGAMVLQRLYDEGASVEELEPSLSLTIASCWLHAGMPERARTALTALRRRNPTLRVKVAGREVPLFDNDAEAVDWLRKIIGSRPHPVSEVPGDWLLVGGDAARNAPSDGGAPLLNVRWRAPVTNDPMMESALKQYQNLYEQRGLPTITMLHPLAVGDVLLMRTLRNLTAIDFATGKRLWEVPVGRPAESASGAAAEELQARRVAMAFAAGQRMWGDLTYGALASDGRRVYSIEDLGLESGDAAQAVRRAIGIGLVVRNSLDEMDPPCNRLAARDISTGKLVWELGGPKGSYALRQSASFFLGPPLPLMGRLYVLAESKGEVRLLALDPADGDLFWSQQLSVVERNVSDDLMRRWAGVSPSYADGVLVCPTSTGAVVGIELATRSLLWGYCYEQDQNSRRNRVRIIRGRASPGRWIGSEITIHDGRALVAPQDSDRLYCLDLIDGELLWKVQRDNDLYVACADDVKVVLVGGDAVRALRLEDGKPAWDGRKVALPDGSSPSGRGFLADDHYYLPLSSAEVAAVDLDAGRIERVSKSREGTVPGNLICHRGKIVSQGREGVDAYFQLDVARSEVSQRLNADPVDPWALTLRGEIQLDSGRRGEAVASFRRAYELSAAPRPRILLRETLFDGLREQFAVYRRRREEIERLLDDNLHRATYLRLMASGLRGEDEWAEAFEHYLTLCDLEPNRPPLDEVGEGHLVRRDRWIRAQLAELRKEAEGAAAAAKIDQAVSDRMESALTARSIGPLRRFLDNFGDLPTAEPAKDELIRRLRLEGRRLEAELAAPPADDPPATEKDEYAVDWPSGKVKIDVGQTKNPERMNMRYYYPVEIRGGAGPCLRGLSIKYDYRQRAIVALDGWGEEAWKVSLAEETKNVPHNYSMIHARAVGRLLLVSLGWKVFAIDALTDGDAGKPRLLWAQDLSETNLAAADLSMFGQFPVPLGALPPQLQRHFLNARDQSDLLGAACGNYVCLQRSRDVSAVDPRNGETLWVRRDLPSACDVFGDRQYVFVLTTDGEEAVLLRAGDGARLGERELPRRTVRQRMPDGEIKEAFAPLDSTCLAVLGRKLLLWWPEGNQRELTLIDPLEQRDLWPRREFDADARTCVAYDEAVAVMQPDGRFALFSLPEGRTIADLKLQPEPNLIDIILFKSADRFFLVTNRRPKSGNMPPIHPVPYHHHRSTSPIGEGRLYAFDSQGKPLWPEPAKVEKQILLSDQPAGLPLVVFACQHYERQPNGRGQWKPRVLCINKRDGRIVYEEQFDNHMRVFDVACDAEKKTVTLTMQKKTVTLTYTDDPLPPPPAADADPAKPSSAKNAADALWKSIRNTFAPKAIEAEEEERLR